MWCNPFLGLQFERNNWKIVKAFGQEKRKLPQVHGKIHSNEAEN
jgi:hypothetical protein